MNSLIKKIVDVYKTHLGYANDLFTPEEYEYRYGKSDRFPSLFSMVVRFLLKYLHIAVPVIWVLVLIFGAFSELEYYKVLIVSPLATVIAILLIALAFVVLMAIEFFSKLIASLIQYGELPKGAENPVEDWLLFLLTWTPNK